MSEIDQVINEALEKDANVEVVDGAVDDGGQVVDGDNKEGDDGVVAETPSWLADDDPADNDEGKKDGETVPVAKLASIRQRLKKKVSQAETENAELKARLAALENPAQQQGQARQVPSGGAPKMPLMPREADFDYDEVKFSEALRNYEAERTRYDDQMFADRQNRVRQESNQKRKIEEFQESINTAYESHLDKADELITKHELDVDRYQTANDNFMEAITRNLPEAGRELGAKDVIKRLGPASAQIAYKFGNNPKRLAKLEGWIREDPSCFTLFMRLGAEIDKINEPVSRKSKARPPAANATGGSSGGGAEGQLLKKYLTAKGDNLQAAMDIKDKARKSGIDVSDWWSK